LIQGVPEVGIGAAVQYQQGETQRIWPLVQAWPLTSEGEVTYIGVQVKGRGVEVLHPM